VIQSAKGFWAKVIDVLGMKILRRDGFVMLALLFSAAAWYPGIMVMVLIGGGAVFLNVIGHYVFAKASH
jgi:hypothetical protein